MQYFFFAEKNCKNAMSTGNASSTADISTVSVGGGGTMGTANASSTADISTVSVVGGGTMGVGISMAFADAGMQVRVLCCAVL